MRKEELARIIEETILEMLEEGDDSLIDLMMEHEKNFNGEEVDRETFINETVENLKDSLGILEEDVDEEDLPMIEEQRKMLSLVEYLDTGDESVLREASMPKDQKELESRERGRLKGYSEEMFGKIAIGDEFKMAMDPGDAILVKVSKTHYKVKSSNDKYSVGLKEKFGNPKDKVYTKKG